MTPPSPVPTWEDIDRFCRADGWEPRRSTDHKFWTKVLPSGEGLRTHRSFSASAEISDGLFAHILRSQLRVSREQFWQTIRSGKPASRTSAAALDPAPPEHPTWVVVGLLRHGLTNDAIAAMSPRDAREALERLWAEAP